MASGTHRGVVPVNVNVFCVPILLCVSGFLCQCRVRAKSSPIVIFEGILNIWKHYAMNLFFPILNWYFYHFFLEHTCEGRQWDRHLMECYNQACFQLLQQQMGSSTSSGATASSLSSQLGNLQQLPSLNNVSVQQLLAASQGNLATQQMFDSPGMSQCIDFSLY